MKRNGTIRLAIAAGICAAGFPVHAHHSYALFDRCTSVTLDGQIENVEWANPHIVINLKMNDGQTYRVEWFSLQQFENAQLAPRVLKAGDRVVITGAAMRDPATKVMSLLTEISRASDGWNWTRAPRATPPECAQHQ